MWTIYYKERGVRDAFRERQRTWKTDLKKLEDKSLRRWIDEDDCKTLMVTLSIFLKSKWLFNYPHEQYHSY